MTESAENLAYHAAQMLENPAFLAVVERIEKEALERIVATKGWKLSMVAVRRQAIVDEVNAVRRIRDDLRSMVRAGQSKARVASIA